MKLTGNKVNLRDIVPEDIDDYRRWFSPGSAWQAWDGPWERYGDWMPKSLESVTRLATTEAPDPRVRLEIETASGRHIGWVNSHWISEACQWRDCGIVIAEDLWERGYGTEAFRMFVDYILNAFDLPRIGMGTWSGNQRMIRCAAAIGLRQEARFADARLIDGKWYDAVRWGITRTEWESYQAPATDGLRRFRPSDRSAVIELTRQLYAYHRRLQNAPEFTEADARESVAEWSAKQGVATWVWQESGEVVGFARARYAGVYFFEELVVEEKRRGKGVGRRMMTGIETELRGAGESDVFLSMVWPGNKRAIDLYRAWGYDLINTIELRKGLNEDRRGEEIEFLDQQFFLRKTNQAGSSGRE